MKNFNAVSLNRARPYFQIQHGRGEVRARRVYLNVHPVTGNVVDTDDLLSFGDGNAAGSLETTPKAAIIAKIINQLGTLYFSYTP